MVSRGENHIMRGGEARSLSEEQVGNGCTAISFREESLRATYHVAKLSSPRKQRQATMTSVTAAQKRISRHYNALGQPRRRMTSTKRGRREDCVWDLKCCRVPRIQHNRPKPSGNRCHDPNAQALFAQELHLKEYKSHISRVNSSHVQRLISLSVCC